MGQQPQSRSSTTFVDGYAVFALTFIAACLWLAHLVSIANERVKALIEQLED